MRRLTVILSLVILVSACPGATEEDPLTLSEALADIASEVNEAVGDLFETLAQPYEDRSQLYTRLIDLRLPTTFAIQLDKAQRVEPPPSTQAELDRYITFLEELLFASEDLDSAIAGEDPAATALSAVQVEVAAGALAAVLPSASCSVLVPSITRDLCGRVGAQGYEAGLDFEMRRFVASFRPAFRIPATFGDVIRARVLGSLQEDATLVLQNTATRLEALDPEPAYQRLHGILIDYFPRAAVAWAEFPADPTGSDPLLYGFLTESLESIRVEARDALQLEYDIVLAANAESQIVEILGIWFDPPPEEPEA